MSSLDVPIDLRGDQRDQTCGGGGSREKQVFRPSFNATPWEEFGKVYS